MGERANAILMLNGPHHALQGSGLDAEGSKVKVCPHCAEELPDDATVCSECHKDPSVLPEWAMTGRSYEPVRGRLGDEREPDGSPELIDRIERLEDATRERPIPPVVWVSLALSFGPLISLLPRVGLTGTILGIAGLVAGLVLGLLARWQIQASNGRLGGMIWANIAIALNAIRFVGILLAYSWIFLAR